MEKPPLGATLDAERSWQPATFAERGVAIPFTTPALAGARARRGPRGLEVVVPQPAGARGVYILAWPALGEYCAPTLHDLRLSELIAAGVSLAPPAMRDAARTVSAEGLAGRRARGAAASAHACRERVRLLMNAMLLERLVTQMHGLPGTLADLEQRAKSCLRKLAGLIGRPAEALIDDVNTLANLYVCHRLAPQLDDTADGPGSCARLVSQLLVLAGSLRGAGEGSAGEGSAGGAIAGAADRCAAMAGEAAASALALLGDVPGLLTSWGTGRATIVAAIGRADWLLDGWQQIVLIRQAAADDGQRLACLPELALLVPPVPREACGWPGDRGDDVACARGRQHLARQAGGQGGAALFDLVARNEMLLALAA